MNANCTKNEVVSVLASALTNQVATLVNAQMVTVWLLITAPVKVILSRLSFVCLTVIHL